MKKIILGMLALIIGASLFASEFINPKDNTIIDIGVRKVSPISPISKEWYEYQPIISEVSKLARMLPRDEELELCVTDDKNDEYCPLESEECDAEYDYMVGKSLIKYGTIYAQPICANGTYNYTTKRCEKSAYCQNGKYNKNTGKCEWKTVQKVRTAKILGTGDWYYCNKWGTRIDAGAWNSGACSRNQLYAVLNCIPSRYQSYSYSAVGQCQSSEGVSSSCIVGDGHRWGANAILPNRCNPWVNKQTSHSENPKCDPVSMSRSKFVCYEATVCGDGYFKNSENVCQRNYKWYKYYCPDENNYYGNAWAGPLVDEGSDCSGSCGSNDCTCNNPEPPKDNCRRETYECPIDSSTKCVRDGADSGSDGTTVEYRRPMQVVSVEGSFQGPGYGQLSELECPGGVDCTFNVKRMISKDNYIEFYPERVQIDPERITVPECSFSGEITGNISYITISDSMLSMNGYDVNGNNLGSITSTCKMNGKVGFKNSIGINSVIAEENMMKFWNIYQGRHNLGFIEFIKQVSAEDEADGYGPEFTVPYDMINDGLRAIYSYGGSTIAASKDTMTKKQCDNLGNKYQMGYASFTSALKEQFILMTTLAPDKVNDFSQGEGYCVLEKTTNFAFSDNDFALKEVTSAGHKYACGHLSCVEHECGLAHCVEGYDGKINKNSVPDGCTDQSCDAKLPYQQECGREQGCDFSQVNIVEVDNNCYKLDCKEGTTYNAGTKKCDSFECPSGTVEQRDGSCI